MATEIGGAHLKNFRTILSESEHKIVLVAEQPADLAGHVVVVDEEVLGGLPTRDIGPADSAASILLGEDGLVLLHVDAVTGLELRVLDSIRMGRSVSPGVRQDLLWIFGLPAPLGFCESCPAGPVSGLDLFLVSGVIGLRPGSNFLSVCFAVFLLGPTVGVVSMANLLIRVIHDQKIGASGRC